ncbi:L,D-transpeptidase family protein [Paracoccus pacificus]|uniref:L,D-transpeptidase family protein n=1 Tax=Paracoccus pacificus TaxID=1463598 RepID=A0ABW4R1P5_9RHOB
MKGLARLFSILSLALLAAAVWLFLQSQGSLPSRPSDTGDPAATAQRPATGTGPATGSGTRSATGSGSAPTTANPSATRTPAARTPSDRPAPSSSGRPPRSMPDAPDLPLPIPENPRLLLPRLPDISGALRGIFGRNPPSSQRSEIPDRPITGPIDRIVIEKSARRLTAYQDGRAIREFRVDLGFQPFGDKEKQGDGRTPEGLFKVDRRNDKSAYHLSLGLNYPRPQDRARARRAGVDPGGDIFIHGEPNKLPSRTRLAADWTAGCIAITNPQIEELFRATAIGTEVEVRP